MIDDMTAVTVAKSDQINAADLLTGPITVKIAGRKITPGQEQPVSIMIEGESKVWRPCKNMCRVMAKAWGPDSSKFVGHSLTLYHDPDVKYGAILTGGIRISHMTGLTGEMVMGLQERKGMLKAFAVKPLRIATAPEPFDVISAGMAVEAAFKAATDKAGLTAAWKANARTLADIKAANGEAHAALVRLSQQIAADFDKAADLDGVSDDGRMG